MRSIDIAAELTKLGVEFTKTNEDTCRIRCPFHDDNHPSCDVKQSKQGFVCRSCRVFGDIFTLLVKLTGQPRHKLLGKYEASSDKPVEYSVVERYHKRIWSAKSLLDELYKRGLSDNTIRVYLLGEHEGRVTIPIANSEGVYVNLRRYLPNAKDVPKTINLRGRGVPPRLFPFDQLQYNKIVLCGGEIKALAALQRLNPQGIGAVSLTAGENEWLPSCEEYFRGKEVWVCLDIDAVGQKASEYRCARLSQVAEWVGLVRLPLDSNKYPTGDINDFIAEGGDLLQCLNSTEKWVGQISLEAAKPEDAPLDLSIKEALSAQMVFRRFQSRVSVTAMGQDAYFIPKDVVPQCSRDQDVCNTCPVYHYPKDTTFCVPPESTAILGMIDSADKFIVDHVRDSLKIPNCPVVTFEVKTRYKVYETRVQRALNLTHQDSDKEAVPTVIVDQETELNETYSIVGKAVPHPRSQRCVAIVSKADAVADALTSFKLAEPEALRLFQPAEWTLESLTERLDAIYHEIEYNVTNIYDRRPLHHIIDLAYHSVLAMRVGKHVQKGVADVLIIGDSSQGKTQVAERLQKFYELGEKVVCKSATVAGILGGLEQIGGKWFVQWGVIPQHDRRLCILDEAKGMRPEVFATLTDMRSSNVAELPKILRRKAQARTRLVWITNAKRQNLSSYSYGIAAIADLIKAPEDIRRFDAAFVVNRNEVNTKSINKNRPHVEETFTADQARKLVLWSWTRTIDEVIIEPESWELCVDEANKMTELFSDTIPLVDKGSMKYKLLRLSAALAGRTFSTDDYNSLIVRPCHVQWVAQMLLTEYSKPAHGYLEYSIRARKREEVLDEKDIVATLATLPNTAATLEHLLFDEDIEAQDFINWCNWTLDEANLLLGKLVRNNALTRENKVYNKTAAFADLLRKMVKDPPQRPKHIPEGESCKY